MPTSWYPFVALALVANVVAFALLLGGLRAKALPRLLWLRKRAVLCAGLAWSASVIAVGLGFVQVLRVSGSDPASKARMLGEGIANTFNGIAFALLAMPLPLVALVVVGVRARRLGAAAGVGLGLALLVAAPPAAAWGDDGHRVVGELAFRHLSASAQAKVREALTEPGYESLAEAATWADTYAKRHHEYDGMRAFHYVNVDPRAPSYAQERDCPNGCVVTALGQFISLLNGATPTSLDERRRCIYWIAHFMGDIHQPLHIAHPDNKGGLNTRLHFFDAPDKRNAHWIWDFGLIERHALPAAAAGQPTYLALSDELDAALTPSKLRAFQRVSDPVQLANEGLALSRRFAYLQSSDHVDAAYAKTRWPIVAEQLQKAGARLALVLERGLGDRAVTERPH